MRRADEGGKIQNMGAERPVIASQEGAWFIKILGNPGERGTLMRTETW